MSTKKLCKLLACCPKKEPVREISPMHFPSTPITVNISPRRRSDTPAEQSVNENVVPHVVSGRCLE